MSTLKPLYNIPPTKSNLVGLINSSGGIPSPQPSPSILRSSSTLRSMGATQPTIPTIPLEKIKRSPKKAKRSPRKRTTRKKVAEQEKDDLLEQQMSERQMLEKQMAEKRLAEEKSDRIFEPIVVEAIVEDNMDDDLVGGSDIKTINDQLMDMELQPMGYIICRANDESDIGVCNYVKVSDKLGHVAFVEPDVQGYVPLNPNSTIFAKKVDYSRVPHSLKNGSISLAGGDVDGVAWECDNEVCMITKDGERQEINEKSFIYEDEDEDRLLSEPIAYPIIKMSALLQQPVMVRQSIEETYLKLRQVDFAKCGSQLENLVCRLDTLNKVIRDYDEYQHTICQRLTQDMQDLYNVYGDYTDGQLCEADIEKKLLIEKNLKVRHEKFIDLVKLNQAFADRQQRIDQLINEYQDLLVFAENNFHSVNLICN